MVPVLKTGGSSLGIKTCDCIKKVFLTANVIEDSLTLTLDAVGTVTTKNGIMVIAYIFLVSIILNLKGSSIYF